MQSNLDKYKKDLEKLVKLGNKIVYSFQFQLYPELKKEFIKNKKKNEKEKFLKLLEELPSFSSKYQEWYSESLSILNQLLPNRVDDFVDLYRKPKTKRKEITHENYVIEDALMGLEVSRTNGWEEKKVIVDSKAAFPRIQQQLHILESVQQKFESSLFDIKQLVQADLFDSELDAARELNKKGFTRGSGAVAGVVLEKHLSQICESHKIVVAKKNPSINDYNQLLKDNEVIEVKDWRFIQRLGDLRNLCDHNKESEPTKEEISELVEGVDKITKTIF